MYYYLEKNTYEERLAQLESAWILIDRADELPARDDGCLGPTLAEVFDLMIALDICDKPRKAA